MFKNLTILGSSFTISLKELSANKTRTLLSLMGIAFGIFCIIGVLATVSSLEKNIQNDINSLGSNSIYIDKWDYSGGANKPYWKFRARPVMKYDEMLFIRNQSQLTDKATFLLQNMANISYQNYLVDMALVYGIDKQQSAIQPISFLAGRYFSDAEFNRGAPVGIIGYQNALDLFGIPESAIGKQVDVKGKKVTIVGVMQKEGKTFIGWDYDQSIMLNYLFAKTIFNEEASSPIIIVKGKENVGTAALTDELRGIMRRVRRLGTYEEDNFSLNTVEAFSKAVSGFFVTLNMVGAFVGGISLIVGLFGITNIMFVTVKERTPVIGLKKALGARRISILLEFLIEAAFVCVIGGIIGLFFVWVLTLILTHFANFPIFISASLVAFTFFLCLFLGVLAGFIPAYQASKMDPVVAIRS